MTAFRRNLVVVASGTVLAQVLTVSVSPILTRIYTPAAFGAFAIFLSIVTILQPVATLRYSAAVPLPEDERTAAQLVVLALLASVGIAALVAAVVGLFPALLGKVGLVGPEPFVPLFGVGLALAGAAETLGYWFMRQRRYRPTASAAVAQSATQAGGRIGLGLQGHQAGGLLWGRVVGQLGAVAVLGWASGRTLRAALVGEGSKGAPRQTRLRDAASTYRRFPLVASGSALINGLGQHLPPILLAACYDAKVAGWYVLAQRIVKTPLNVIGSAVAQVYVGESSHLIRTDRARLKQLFLSSARRLALLGVGPFVLLVAVAPQLFGVVFGAAWVTTGQYIQILGLTFLLQFVLSPLAHTLLMLQRQGTQLVLDVACLGLTVASIVVPSALGRPAKDAILAYAVGLFLVLAATFVANLKSLDVPAPTERP